MHTRPSPTVLLALLPALLLSLTAACDSPGGSTSAAAGAGSGDVATSQDGAGGDGAAAACEDTSETVQLPVGQIPDGDGSTMSVGPKLLGLVEHEGQAWALAGVVQDDLSVELVFARPGEAPRPVATLDEVYMPGGGSFAYYAAPVVSQGKLCAVYTWHTAKLACVDGTEEETGVKGVEAHDQLVPPVVEASGAMTLFAQTHSSYTALVRSVAGEWREVEKYESSVSYPDDALMGPGGPTSCFVSSSDRVHVDGGSATGDWPQGVEGTWCRLATDGSKLFLLAAGALFVTPDDGAGAGGAPVEGLPSSRQDIGPLFLRGDEPYVLVVRGGKLEALGTRGGAPVALSMAPAGGYLVTGDSAGGQAVWGGSWEAGDDSSTRALRLTRECLAPPSH